MMISFVIKKHPKIEWLDNHSAKKVFIKDSPLWSVFESVIQILVPLYGCYYIRGGHVVHKTAAVALSVRALVSQAEGRVF